MRICLAWLILLIGCDDSPAEGADAELDLDAGLGGSDLGDGAALDAVPPCTPPVAPTACPDPPVRYGDVEAIVQTRCTICHDAIQGGPWPLTNYTHVADWQDLIRASMLDCSMPPKDAGVPMTGEERLALLTWIRCGVPR